jgi:alkanesulfonate monooxygenase SsuD/methylene tetrahydromethanopterin reductase-like flavin-dependent oxidoreductase (luciferase family)
MQLGLHLDMRNPPEWRRPWADFYARTLELLTESERCGAGSVWLAEHHMFPDGFMPQPLTFAAAIAARTKRIRLGTAIMQGPLRRTVQLAEEAAIVDIISNGRLDLGLGTGYHKREYDSLGLDFDSRRRALRRQLVELPKLWAAGRVTPPPVQQPIPLWCGFRGPQGAHLAGSLGLGLLAGERYLLEPYLAGLDQGGHDRSKARWAALMFFILSDDPEKTQAELAPYGEYQWDTYRRFSLEGTADAGNPDAADMTLQLARARQGTNWVEALTPEQAVANMVERFGGLPIKHAYCWGSVAGMPDKMVEHHVELMFDRLLPLMRERGLSD